MRKRLLATLALAMAMPTQADYRYPVPMASQLTEHNAVQLGYGYDSVKGEIKPRLLVEGQRLELGNREQSFTLTLDMDQETLSKVTSGASSVSSGGWWGDFDIEGSFSNSHVSDEFSQTLTLVYKITEKDDVLAPELNNWSPYTPGEHVEDTSGALRLTAYGLAESAKDSRTRYDSFGNEVITAVHYGAYLLATLKITYQTKDAKNAAMARASASGFGLEAGGEFVMESGISSLASDMDITIKQVGGSGIELARAAAYFEGLEQLGGSGEFTKDCSGAVSDCASTMDRILSYATGKNLPSYLTGFRDQLQCDNKQDCFAPIGFSTEKWATSGFTEIMPEGGEWTLPILTVEVLNIIKHQYAINQMDNVKAAQLGNSEILAKTNRNMATLIRIADECQRAPYSDACGSYYQQEKSRLEGYDREELNTI